jgi:hypothetical protein
MLVFFAFSFEYIYIYIIFWISDGIIVGLGINACDKQVFDEESINHHISSSHLIISYWTVLFVVTYQS